MRAHESAKIYRRGFTLLIAVLAVAVFAGQVVAAEPVSILTASSGEVSVVRHSSDPAQAFPPRVGMRQVLYEGDMIKTGPGAKAKLLVGDDSLVVMSEESEIKIKKVVDEPASGQRSTNVSIAQGYVRVAFQPLEGSGPSPLFTIETPSATIKAKGSCEGLIMVSEGAKKVTFWSLENTWEMASTDPSASGAVSIPQGHSTEILAGMRPGSPEPVSQMKLAELRDPMTMRETALTRATPSIDRGDFIYQNYESGGWLFASRPRMYRTAAAAPSKKPSYASNGSSNGHHSPEAASTEPVSGSINLVSAVPQGVLSVLHSGIKSVFAENGN